MQAKGSKREIITLFTKKSADFSAPSKPNQQAIKRPGTVMTSIDKSGNKS